MLGHVVTDAALGALMDHLEAEGILDDTLIVFHMDHSMNLKNQVGSTLLGSARLPAACGGAGCRLGLRLHTHTRAQVYNGGTQILYVARYPPVLTGGATTGELVTNLDTGLTFLELAGGASSYPTDGMSWLPLAQGVKQVGGLRLLAAPGARARREGAGNHRRCRPCAGSAAGLRRDRV